MSYFTSLTVTTYKLLERFYTRLQYNQKSHKNLIVENGALRVWIRQDEKKREKVLVRGLR